VRPLRAALRMPVVLAVLLGVWIPGTALAGDWSQFQADAEHSGVAGGPAPPYRTAWETPVPPAGPQERFGLSAPIIVDGLAVATGPEAVVAVDASSGEVAWSHPRELGPSVPAAVAGSGGSRTLLYTEGWGEGPILPGSSSTPAASATPAASPSPGAAGGQDEAAFEGPSRLVAVTWPDREPLWIVDLPQVSRTGVTVVGDLAYVGTNDGSVTAVEVDTGSERWAVDVGQGTEQAIAATGELVLVSLRGSGTEAASLVALSAVDGSESWRYEPAAASLIASPAAVDASAAYVAFSDGTVHAVDLAAGTERWSVPLNSAAPWAPPALADGRVYVLDVAGQLYALDAVTGERSWDHPLNTDVFHPAPVVVGDAVLVGTFTGSVLAFDRDSGDVIWRTDFGAGSVRAIAADERTVVVVRGGAGSGASGLVTDPDGALIAERSPTIVQPLFLLGTWALVSLVLCGLLYQLGRLLVTKLGVAQFADPHEAMQDEEEGP